MGNSSPPGIITFIIEQCTFRGFGMIFRTIDPNTHQLETEQILPLPRRQVFAFFEDPRNLSELTPDWLDFRMIDPDAGATVFEGAEYEYTIRWLPWLWKIRWRSRIIRYNPPVRFTDIQVQGPYRYWEHLHTFEEVTEGTRMVDIVTYRLPFGTLGRFAHRALVKAQLEDIFIYRAARIHEWTTGQFTWKRTAGTTDNNIYKN